MLSYVAAMLHFLDIYIFFPVTINVKGCACANTLQYLLHRGLFTLSKPRGPSLKLEPLELSTTSYKALYSPLYASV